MTERELRTLISKSPSEGHRALFEQYSSYVYAIVWDKIRDAGSREDADECVSDVFAEVFMHLDTVYEGSLKGYIGTVAKRMAINAFRRLAANSGKTVSLEEGFEQMASGEDVAEDYEASAASRLLLDKILSLGDPDATIIIQKYYYNRNSTEIARIVHMSPVAVRMRLSRALKRLKKCLTEDDIMG